MAIFAYSQFVTGQGDKFMIRQEIAKELIDSRLYWPRTRLFAGVYKIIIYN